MPTCEQPENNREHEDDSVKEMEATDEAMINAGLHTTNVGQEEVDVNKQSSVFEKKLPTCHINISNFTDCLWLQVIPDSCGEESNHCRSPSPEIPFLPFSQMTVRIIVECRGFSYI